MLMTLQVNYTDESVAVAPITAADFIRFEETFNRSIAQFQTEFRFTDLCWLAWHSLTRRKVTATPWDEWIETLDSVSPVDDGQDDLVPLETSPHTGQ